MVAYNVGFGGAAIAAADAISARARTDGSSGFFTPAADAFIVGANQTTIVNQPATAPRRILSY
ncbi:MAG: hypothetical protein ACR2OV_08410, partial [Hyphomicrobiaceae bacterium]